MDEIFSYKRILLAYVVVSIASASIEISLTGLYSWSFLVTYISTVLAAPYMRKAINSLFKHFHVKRIIRNLINPWIMYALIAFYCYLFFSTQVANPDYATINFISFVGIVALILVSMPSLIRIVAVAFHRREITIYPINRIEFAAMKYLKNAPENRLGFSKLKNKIRGLFNIFVPNVYFDDEAASSSIYHLCGLRLADISKDTVALNEAGQKLESIWQETLNHQVNTFSKVLDSRGVLVRSFMALFIISLSKIFIGSFSSDSLLADGFENFLDVLAIVLIGIGIRYNRERPVNIALISLMSFTGSSILFYSVRSLLFGPEPISNSLIIIAVAMVSVLLNIYLRAVKNFVGKKNRNSSLVASAIDSKVNIMISVSIIIGALFSDFGAIKGYTFLYYLDPIIAIGVCLLIFGEVIEIFLEFVKGSGEELEFESFQMPYERFFEEYIMKWVFSVYADNPNVEFTLDLLNNRFEESMNKGEEIYSEFSHFGLYLFEERGIDSVVKKLIDDRFFKKSAKETLSITDKGKKMYEFFYSEPLLEDVKDPFDFFFEHSNDFDSMKHRKKMALKALEKS
ncbi:MAG: cation diffusion facilitator family transporter [Promethearchaeota archaeon]